MIEHVTGTSTPNGHAVLAGSLTDPNGRVMARLAKDFPDRMSSIGLIQLIVMRLADNTIFSCIASPTSSDPRSTPTRNPRGERTGRKAQIGATKRSRSR